MGHGFGFVVWPVSLLMVCHTRQLEWVKSIDSTVSVHLSLRLVLSRVMNSVAALVVSALVLTLLWACRSSFSLFVPAGNIVLMDSPRDVFLGGVGKHRAVGHIGIIDVGGGKHWQGFGCGVGAVCEFRPVSLAKVPPPDRFPLCRLDEQWCCNQ